MCGHYQMLIVIIKIHKTIIHYVKYKFIIPILHKKIRLLNYIVYKF